MERFWRENRDRIPLPAAIKDRLIRQPDSLASVLTISGFSVERRTLNRRPKKVSETDSGNKTPCFSHAGTSAPVRAMFVADFATPDRDLGVRRTSRKRRAHGSQFVT